jgi:transcriptional regulator with XRE-family HTH domain
LQFSRGGARSRSTSNKPTDFGNLLAALRERKDLGQVDLAGICRKAGEKTISTSAISGYERGKHLPHPSRARVLSQVLECPLLLQVYQEERVAPWECWRNPPDFSLANQAAAEVLSIRDKYFGQGTPYWRRKQREKDRRLEKRWEEIEARLEERLKAAAAKPPWAPPEGWGPYAETWE